jgi:hypothetical protein
MTKADPRRNKFLGRFSLPATRQPPKKEIQEEVTSREQVFQCGQNWFALAIMSPSTSVYCGF